MSLHDRVFMEAQEKPGRVDVTSLNLPKRWKIKRPHVHFVDDPKKPDYWKIVRSDRKSGRVPLSSLKTSPRETRAARRG